MAIQGRKNNKVLWIGATVVVAVGLGTGAYYLWSGKGQTPDAAPTGREGRHAGFGNRPVPVVAVPVNHKDMPIYLDALGTVQAYNQVTVHSRIDGELTDVAFKEGQEVKEGDVLVRLDSRLYQAQFDQATATRDKDKALLDAAKVDFARYEGLGNRVAGQTLDTQRATVKQLEATVRADQAAIETARTNLTYTTITSPIKGRTGLRLVDKGNIVHASDSTGVVIVAQLQPISVVFSLPQQDLRNINREWQKTNSLPVQALDSDGKGQIDQGELTLIDNQIDQTTGTVKLKATLPNAKLRLWPGGFANIRLQLTTRENALVVPATAVQRGPQGAFVYVVTPDHTALIQAVKVGPIEGDDALIESGLEGSESVIIEGMSRLQNGAKIEASAPGASQPTGDKGNGEGGRERHWHKDGKARKDRPADSGAPNSGAPNPNAPNNNAPNGAQNPATPNPASRDQSK